MPETVVVDAAPRRREWAQGSRRATVSVSVALSLIGKAAELVTLLVLATVVPRALGPADYGRFAVPLTIVTVGSLALTLGGPLTLARFVPAAPPEQRVALARRLGARLARGRALQLAIIGVGATALTLWDRERFSPWVTALVVVALAFNVVATLLLQVALGLGRTSAWSARYPLHNAVLVVAVLVLHAAGGVSAAIGAIVIAAVVAVVFAAVVTVPVARVPSAPAAIPPGAIRFGLLLAAGAAVTQVVHRGGVLAVALLDGSDTETGHAALAIGVALGITYAVQQAFTVTLPHLAQRDATDGARAEATLPRLAGGMLAVLIPAATLAAVGIGTLVPAVFGAQYDDAAQAFVPALAMIVLAPINALAVPASALRLRPQAAVIGAATGAVAFVVTALATIPDHGATGATLAMLAAATASSIASLVVLPGAVGCRVAIASYAGAALVLTLGFVA